MIKFLIQFLKTPRKIGAVAPSGKSLARKMMEPIQFEGAKCIVEFGPGTGSFTRELMKRKDKDTTLLLIEQNPSFCKQLRQEIPNNRNVHVIEGSAEHVNEYLKKFGFDWADYIVSGLPFTSLPTKVSDTILLATKKAIGRNGQFITFQYSLVKKKFFENYFRITNCLKELRNLPPAYVFVMKAGMNHQKDKNQ